MGNGEDNLIVIHLTLIPYLSAVKELKTKPTQHSVKTLMESGVQADILVYRTEHELNDEIKEKLARFCNVNVIVLLNRLMSILFTMFPITCIVNV